MAALKENVSLSKVATVPGSEVSGYTHNDVDSSTASVSTMYQKYYFTYGTGFEANGTKFNLTYYEDMLADTIWCNDKSTSSGLGYGTSTTNYSVYGRLVTFKKPTLICSKDNSGESYLNLL